MEEEYSNRIDGCDRFTQPEDISALKKYLRAIKEDLEERTTLETDNLMMDPSYGGAQDTHLPEDLEKLGPLSSISSLPDMKDTVDVEKINRLEQVRLKLEGTNPDVSGLPGNVESISLGTEKINLGEELVKLGSKPSDEPSLPKTALPIEGNKKKPNLPDEVDNPPGDHSEEPKLEKEVLGIDLGKKKVSLDETKENLKIGDEPGLNKDEPESIGPTVKISSLPDNASDLPGNLESTLRLSEDREDIRTKDIRDLSRSKEKLDLGDSRIKLSDELIDLGRRQKIDSLDSEKEKTPGDIKTQSRLSSVLDKIHPGDLGELEKGKEILGIDPNSTELSGYLDKLDKPDSIEQLPVGSEDIFGNLPVTRSLGEEREELPFRREPLDKLEDHKESIEANQRLRLEEEVENLKVQDLIEDLPGEKETISPGEEPILGDTLETISGEHETPDLSGELEDIPGKSKVPSLSEELEDIPGSSKNLGLENSLEDLPSGLSDRIEELGTELSGIPGSTKGPEELGDTLETLDPGTVDSLREGLEKLDTPGVDDLRQETENLPSGISEPALSDYLERMDTPEDPELPGDLENVPGESSGPNGIYDESTITSVPGEIGDPSTVYTNPSLENIPDGGVDPSGAYGNSLLENIPNGEVDPSEIYNNPLLENTPSGIVDPGETYGNPLLENIPSEGVDPSEIYTNPSLENIPNGEVDPSGVYTNPSLENIPGGGKDLSGTYTNPLLENIPDGGVDLKIDTTLEPLTDDYSQKFDPDKEELPNSVLGTPQGNVYDLDGSVLDSTEKASELDESLENLIKDDRIGGGDPSGVYTNPSLENTPGEIKDLEDIYENPLLENTPGNIGDLSGTYENPLLENTPGEIGDLSGAYNSPTLENTPGETKDLDSAYGGSTLESILGELIDPSDTYENQDLENTPGEIKTLQLNLDSPESPTGDFKDLSNSLSDYREDLDLDSSSTLENLGKKYLDSPSSLDGIQGTEDNLNSTLHLDERSPLDRYGSERLETIEDTSKALSDYIGIYGQEDYADLYGALEARARHDLKTYYEYVLQYTDNISASGSMMGERLAAVLSKWTASFSTDSRLTTSELENFKKDFFKTAMGVNKEIGATKVGYSTLPESLVACLNSNSYLRFIADQVRRGYNATGKVGDVINKISTAWGLFNTSNAKETLVDTVLMTLVEFREKLERSDKVNRDRLPGGENILTDIARKGIVGTAQSEIEAIRDGVVGGIVGAIQDKGVDVVDKSDPINRPEAGVDTKGWKYPNMKLGEGSKTANTFKQRLKDNLKNSFNDVVDSFSGGMEDKNYLFQQEYLRGSGIAVTAAELFESGQNDIGDIKTLEDLKTRLMESSLMTSPSKFTKTSSLDSTIMTLDSDTHWEVIVEPFLGKDNGYMSFLPSTEEINVLNRIQHNVITKWNRWIPIVSFDLNKSRLSTKSLGIYGGEITFPNEIEFTNEISITVVDDMYKSWRRYFEKCVAVSTFNSTSHSYSFYGYSGEGGKLKYNGPRSTFPVGFDKLSPYEKTTGNGGAFAELGGTVPNINMISYVDMSSPCTAPYKNVTFRIRIYSMTPQYSTINRYDLLCTLKEFSEERSGSADPGSQDLTINFSIVGENPDMTFDAPPPENKIYNILESNKIDVNKIYNQFLESNEDYELMSYNGR